MRDSRNKCSRRNCWTAGTGCKLGDFLHEFRLCVKFDGDEDYATVFQQVRIDTEAHTLVWPNGADCDPETLHDWPKEEAAFRLMAERWAGVSVS